LALEQLHCIYFSSVPFSAFVGRWRRGFPESIHTGELFHDGREIFDGQKKKKKRIVACIGGVWVHLEPAFRPVRGNHLHIQIGGNISSHDILVLNFFGGPGWIFVLSFTLDDFSRRISMDV